MKTFEIGEITNKIWAGDLISKCEFIMDLSLGLMLFRDLTFNCYRLVYRVPCTGGELLNGWICGHTIEEVKGKAVKLIKNDK